MPPVPTDTNTFLLYIIVGVFLPFIVDLVTKKVAEPRVKSLTLLVLSLVGSGLTELFNQGLDTFDWKTWVLGFFYTVGSAVVTLFGVAKPAGISGKSGVLANLVPGGIGKPGVQVLTTDTVSTSNLNSSATSDIVENVPVVTPDTSKE